MRLEKIKSRGLAHLSYYLSDGGEALVVDPRRDSRTYAQLAEEECAEIECILETHRNEDYVVGSLELQSMTGAEIAHSKETPFGYGERRLGDDDGFEVGRLRVEAIYTPGHTNDSLCYSVFDPLSGDEPLMLFTGDTLLAGGVGRTDLLGPKERRRQSERLYESLHERLLPLGDHILVYPAHGAGSVCGSNLSDREVSTIGFERRTNPLLGAEEEEFVEQMMSQRLMTPPYFRRMEEVNLEGATLLKEAPSPRPLSVEGFEEAMRQTASIVVDTREPGAFAGSHIPGSIGIWLDGLSHHPGWVLSYDERILLVTERREDVETAKAYLNRLGFDQIVGYLCPGIRGWRDAGGPVEHLGTLSATSLREKLERGEVRLIDVREEGEWEEGHIEGTERIYVGNLKEQAGRLPRDKPLATICSFGGRSGLGASILKGMDFDEVYNVLGGMRAWRSLKYPLKGD